MAAQRCRKGSLTPPLRSQDVPVSAEEAVNQKGDLYRDCYGAANRRARDAEGRKAQVSVDQHDAGSDVDRQRQAETVKRNPGCAAAIEIARQGLADRLSQDHQREDREAVESYPTFQEGSQYQQIIDLIRSNGNWTELSRSNEHGEVRP